MVRDGAHTASNDFLDLAGLEGLLICRDFVFRFEFEF
jgi:hypothetical protein